MASSVSVSSPAGIAERYDSSIVVRRWGATWIDFLVLIGLVAACFALPEAIQRACLLDNLLRTPPQTAKMHCQRYRRQTSRRR